MSLSPTVWLTSRRRRVGLATKPEAAVWCRRGFGRGFGLPVRVRKHTERLRRQFPGFRPESRLAQELVRAVIHRRLTIHERVGHQELTRQRALQVCLPCPWSLAEESPSAGIHAFAARVVLDENSWCGRAAKAWHPARPPGINSEIFRAIDCSAPTTWIYMPPSRREDRHAASSAIFSVPQ
jgi:hypothetical protein